MLHADFTKSNFNYAQFDYKQRDAVDHAKPAGKLPAIWNRAFGKEEGVEVKFREGKKVKTVVVSRDLFMRTFANDSRNEAQHALGSNDSLRNAAVNYRYRQNVRQKQASELLKVAQDQSKDEKPEIPSDATVEAYKAAASAGSAIALSRVELYVKIGRMFPKDAKSIFKSAAKNGSSTAQVLLGIMNLKSENTSDQKAGFKALKRLADRGNAQATQLIESYNYNKEQKKPAKKYESEPVTTPTLEKVTLQDAEGMFNSAQQFENEGDGETALRLYRLAAEEGSAQAEIAVDRLTLPKDEKSILEFARAGKSKYAEGEVLKRGRELSAFEPDKAKKYFEAVKTPAGQFELGRLLLTIKFKGNGLQQLRKGQELIYKAAESGDQEARKWLRTYQMRPRGPNPDVEKGRSLLLQGKPVEAFEHFRKAAMMDNAEGRHHLGILLRKPPAMGGYPTTNLDLSKRYLELSAAQGYQLSKDNLKVKPKASDYKMSNRGTARGETSPTKATPTTQKGPPPLSPTKKGPPPLRRGPPPLRS